MQLILVEYFNLFMAIGDPFGKIPSVHNVETSFSNHVQGRKIPRGFFDLHRLKNVNPVVNLNNSYIYIDFNSFNFQRQEFRRFKHRQMLNPITNSPTIGIMAKRYHFINLFPLFVLSKVSNVVTFGRLRRH